MPTQDFKGTVEGIDIDSKLTIPGAWTTPAFNAANFTASGSMTWTVAEADVSTFAYIIMGKIMTILFDILTSSVGGEANTALLITIPGGVTPTKRVTNAVYISDNGTKSIGRCVIAASGSVITIYKADGSAFGAATDTTSVEGQITLEIN